MKHSFSHVFALVVVFLIARPVAAQIPPTISFQGFLTDSTGAPLTGEYEMTVRLFESESEGSSFWEETHSPVEVVAGIYHIQIGSVEPLEGIDFAAPYFLQIEIGGETVGDRRPLDSVPYSFFSQYAEKVGAVNNLCQSGDFIHCYSGDPGTIDVGECKAGRRLCNGSKTGFGTCTGEILPGSEACDGLDNDCDGVADEFPCCVQDDFEPNNTMGTAAVTSPITCGDGAGRDGTFYDTSDVDWFTYAADDATLCSVSPSFSVTSPGAVVEICAYFDCDAGTTQVGCLSGATHSSAGGLNGCCDEGTLDASVSCSGATSDDASVAMKLTPISVVQCKDYTIYYSY